MEVWENMRLSENQGLVWLDYSLVFPQSLLSKSFIYASEIY